MSQTFSSLTLPRLITEPIVRAALLEDLGRGDITTDAVVPVTAKAECAIVARDPG